MALGFGMRRGGTGEPVDFVGETRWRYRPIVIQGSLAEVQAALDAAAKIEEDLKERNVQFVVALPSADQVKLQKTFDCVWFASSADKITAIYLRNDDGKKPHQWALVGYDGSVKAAGSLPIDFAKEIMAKIDTMPMRKDEMADKKFKPTAECILGKEIG
ncbi:unnamed protein product [Vitrella brassicaformis CCMP3155]|uniref:DUF4174 domain-containing protein n=1 Tax=Vitrella brassicaformis (strain CCMP3155) TaxID=1169540 RepID=A0A0G4H058_VITBC|nr:unnamed protein product [Vitrella brassicaformis CCMP3155]|eukprot:CEM36890.1 unnamed protein product [Vitrella brassicaformis CCMP3155]